MFTSPVCEVPGLCSLHQCARSQGCVHFTSVRGPRVVFTPPEGEALGAVFTPPVCEAPGVVFTPPVCEAPGVVFTPPGCEVPGVCSLHQGVRRLGCVHSTRV